MLVSSLSQLRAGDTKGTLFEAAAAAAGETVVETIDGFIVAKIEGNSQGNSYFDRLWKTGAGSHAETNDRCVTD